MAIDGVLAESAWDRAEKAGPFVRSLDGKPATAATEARLLWDDDHLYVAFLCEDANVSGAFFKDDEKLYTSNVVEIFLNPSGDGSHYDDGCYVHVHDGSCFDPLQVVAPAALVNYESEVKKLTSGCSVIATGPLAASQGQGQAGEGQALSPPMRGDFHALDRFATLRFED